MNSWIYSVLLAGGTFALSWLYVRNRFTPMYLIGLCVVWTSVLNIAQALVTGWNGASSTIIAAVSTILAVQYSLVTIWFVRRRER